MVIIMIGVFSGCIDKKYIYTHDELGMEISSRLNVTAAEAENFIPFTPNETIEEMAKQVRRQRASTKGRVDRILELLVGNSALGIEYEKGATHKAYQVLVNKSANCIAYTNLFISIARRAGLDAVYVDVTQVKKYDTDGAMNYKEGHICAGVLTPAKTVLVDFVYNSREYKKYNIIDDLEAVANYLTILGVQSDKKYLDTGDAKYLKQAFDYQRRALKIYPRLTRAMNNLGVLYLRDKNYTAAESLFTQALALDDEMDVARFNLAELYLRKGNAKLAEEVLLENLDKTIDDPYTHFRLGQIYFSQKKPSLAEYHLKEAISLNNKDIKPRLLLISLLLNNSRFEEAEDLLDDAEDLMPGNQRVLEYRDILKKKI